MSKRKASRGTPSNLKFTDWHYAGKYMNVPGRDDLVPLSEWRRWFRGEGKYGRELRFLGFEFLWERVNGRVRSLSTGAFGTLTNAWGVEVTYRQSTPAYEVTWDSGEVALSPVDAEFV